MKAKFVKCLVALSTILMAGGILLGCEKETKTQPKGRIWPVRNVVAFTPRMVHCRVGDVITPEIYVDYEKIYYPAEYNIKFKPCDPSVLSVDEDGVITVLKRDSAYVSLYCENNGKVYKDTMLVLPGLPSGNDDYYIKNGYDLNNDKFMSDYEMSRVDVVEQFSSEDLPLLKSLKYLRSSYTWYGNMTVDFTNNTQLKNVRLGNYKQSGATAIVNIKLPDLLDLECLFLLTSDLDYITLKDLHIPVCPKLDTLKVFYFNVTNIDIASAESMRFIHLCCSEMKKIDLSMCPNINNITIYNMGDNCCTVVLAPKVFVKYITKDSSLKVDIDSDIEVVEAEP